MNDWRIIGKSIFLNGKDTENTQRKYTGIVELDNGHVFACVDGGGIYMARPGSLLFQATENTSREWVGICQGLEKDTLIAAVRNGDIYKSKHNSNLLLATGQPSRKWEGLCFIGERIVACDESGKLYYFGREMT